MNDAPIPAAAPNSETSGSPAASAAPPTPASDLIDIDQFSKVKLRVGQVISAEKVEKSKKLLKLQVDLGAELGTRQVLSGISQFYAPEQMVGKKVVVVANLKPVTMMGLESHGMLLAAATPERVLFVISPSDETPIGSSVA